MKTIYEIDEQGFMTYQTMEIEPIGEEDGVPLYELPENYIPVPLPSDAKGNQLPFWKPKWNGTEWIEARPKAEIEAEKNKPLPLTPVEELQEANANLWYDSMMKDVKISDIESTNADIAYEVMLKDMQIMELNSAQADLAYTLMMNGVL